ncbi:MAG: T9SS type A sorting domain-containing protein [Bacteroidota bacterium]
MKKILLSSLVALSVLGTAQNKSTIHVSPGKQLSKHPKITYAALHHNVPVAKTTNQNGSAWFNQLDYNELILAGQQVLSPMHLFPDSTIILGFDASDAPVYTWIHKAGNYVDPAWMPTQSIITDKFATYTMDSIAVGYSYIRGATNNVADSLIIQIIAENHSLDWDIGSGAFSYQDIVYNQATNEVKAGSGLNGVTILKRISYALTTADSTSEYSHIKFATSGIAPQTNSKKIGAVVSFKPAYTWTTADTLLDSHRTNTFFLWSSEQQGANTDPVYNGTTGDYTSDMNMSYIIPQDIRYNQNANGWNGYFIPTYAYTTPFAYENHDIGYKLTVNITGVNELEQKGFALGQNVPNPYTQSSVIEFELAKNVNSAIFTVTDVTGRIVSSEKVSSSVGKHAISLGAYAAGVYYYSLNVDGKISTKKMIIQ